MDRRRWGLVKALDLPPWLEVPLALVLLDYSLYLWHVVMHRLPRLWRLHQVHHVDLDMDASTALRFHAGEMVASVGVRVAQILGLGVSPLTLSVRETWLLCGMMFHHSNVRLPYGLERRLARVLVTPRMHGIHHSIVPEELNANWSNGLTVWDRLPAGRRTRAP